jgi:predicted acyl esterase
MRIDWDVPIEMDDGVVLRCDVFRPIADGRYPVLMCHGPYGKGLAMQEGFAGIWAMLCRDHPDVPAGSTNKYQNWEAVDPEKWVPHGYVCVRVDSRGAGRSPGVMDLFSPRETRDYYTCIEWAGTQPWSNGKVGLAGISYYAINQWQVAALQPPHLAAICPWEGAADFYRDWSYHGGIRNMFTARCYPAQVRRVQHGRGTRAPAFRDPNTGELVSGPQTLSDQELEQNHRDLAAQIAAHPFDDEWHQARTPDWSKVTVPLLSAASWGGQGLHPRGNYEGFLRAASRHRWLEVHGLEHWTHFYTDYGRVLQRRFFDHFLKGGADNGWSEQPRVLLHIRHPGERFVQRGENEWPLARTRWTRCYLDARDRTLGAEPTATAASVTYEGMGEGVTFWMPAVAEETEITGPLSAKLFVSSQTEGADLFVILRLFDPDGKEVHFMGTIDPHTPIAQGWLRASHRKLDLRRSTDWQPYHPHGEREPLTPGQVYELDIELWPTCIVVPAGYRLALTVQGKDYEYGGAPINLVWVVMQGCGPFLHDDPNDRPAAIFGGKVTLHTGGDRPSSILLPIIG